MDLNCDLGESDDRARIAADMALLRMATSANIACGGHAGSPESMIRTAKAAAAREVCIGAHPGYADRANFGRVSAQMTPREVEEMVYGQLSLMAKAARRAWATMSHVKPHGALYHDAMTNAAIAEAIARATARVKENLVLVGLAGSPALALWAKMGFRVGAEAFADRRYESDGTLRSRAHTDSMIANPVEAGLQAVTIALRGRVETVGGRAVEVHADTICVHGDTPDAPAMMYAVRDALQNAGIPIAGWERRPPRRVVMDAKVTL